MKILTVCTEHRIETIPAADRSGPHPAPPAPLHGPLIGLTNTDGSVSISRRVAGLLPGRRGLGEFQELTRNSISRIEAVAHTYTYDCAQLASPRACPQSHLQCA